MADIEAELSELRTRLADAEETLHAIHTGEVDALVIATEQGEQVFTLAGAEHPYRVLIEEMNEGAATLDEGGAILFCNRHLAELVCAPVEQILGTMMQEWIVPEERAAFCALLRRAYSEPCQQELTMVDQENGIPILLSMTALKTDALPLLCAVITDLTIQKRNEAIIASEHLFRTVLDQAADAIVVCDESGRIIQANHVARGLGGEIMLGELFETVFPLAYSDGKYATLSGFLNAPATKRTEVTYLQAGKSLTILASVAPLLGVDALPLGSVVTLMDITGRKRSEEALRESEIRYRTLFNALQDAVLLSPVDGEGVPLGYIQVNEAASHMYGYSINELLGMGPQDLVAPEYRALIQALGIQLIKNGHYRVEREDRTKSGRRVPVDVSVTLLELQGQLACISVVRDMTDHKQAEEQIHNHLRFLDTIMENCPFAMWISDSQGTVCRTNKTLRDALEYEDAQIVGLYNVFRDVNLIEQGVMSQVHAVFEEHAPARFTIFWSSAKALGFTTRKKKDFWIDAAMYPIMDGRGNLANVVCQWNDVTQQKQLQEQLHQAQKMEAVGQLAGGVAHDFNNILQAVIGYGNILMDSLEENNKTYEYAREIIHGAERAAALTRQLLTFSRRQIMAMEELDLNVVTEQLVKMLQRLIGEDIRLNIVLSERPGRIHADKVQVEQILLNLCVNAREAMPQGGTLTIATENVSFDEEFCIANPWASPGNYVLLRVADTGCGMDLQTQERIFEPFFTTKEASNGTGLGLATVYGIVRQHQGMILVYSEVGIGTTFKTYFPFSVREAPVIEIKSNPSIKGGSETILVAEDEEALRVLAVRILESAGYKVLLAADGQEALELFEKHATEIDLLLLDVVMPRMGGKAVYDTVHQRWPNVRYLFMTGYSSSAIHTDFVLEEGLNLLQKPYDLGTLLQKIREILDRAPADQRVL